MTRRLLSLAIAAGAVVAGCGSSSPPISSSAAAQLQQDVAGIRSLATARDVPGVSAKLAELRSRVAQLESAKQITPAAGNRILAAATAVTEQLALITTTTTSTTSTTTTPPSVTAPPVTHPTPGPKAPKPHHDHGD